MNAENPSLSDLVDALPAGYDGDFEQSASAQAELQRLLSGIGSKPVPTGRLKRAWSLGTLQAKIVAAYLAWWLRSGFKTAEAKRQGLDETHVAAAIQVLGRMSYMRGAVMKLGQIIAHWPHMTPTAFASVLARLHMDAPPMHFALLREQLQRELGAPPEELFDDFETEAFAAASLGQVHRAKLKGSGKLVAIKIQYPGIASTIRSDLRNLKAVSFPMRLSGDWQNMLEQFEGIQTMLEQEIDYVEEAKLLNEARVVLADFEDIVVPEVIPEFSTKRVLTMEYLEGQHLEEFLSNNPSQELRNRHGDQINRAGFRMWYSGRTVYADPHPGNYLFLPDGRLGLLDFGCCHRFSEEEYEYVTQVERGAQGSIEELDEAIARGCDMKLEEFSEERLALMREYCEWLWDPLREDGPFDFGVPGYFERGMRLYGEFTRRRWTRSVPVNVWLTKLFFGVRAMLCRLEAVVDYGAIMERESKRG